MSAMAELHRAATQDGDRIAEFLRAGGNPGDITPRAYRLMSSEAQQLVREAEARLAYEDEESPF